MSEEATAAKALQEAVAHLGAKRFSEALPLLASAEASLAVSPDLEDFHARTLSLLAQALLELNRPTEARTRAHAAIRILRRLQDGEGLKEVRALDERIGAAIDQTKRATLAKARAKTMASRTTEEVEAATASPLAAADALLKHAAAKQLTGDLAGAAASARRAILAADTAQSVRERVLARLALAEAEPRDASEPLRTALDIADSADETTLIGLIARAAELADVALPQHHGPLNIPYQEDAS